MLPVWVPEISFGNAITLTLLFFTYLDLRTRVGRNLSLLRTNNDIATLAAGHAKLSFDTSANNAVTIRATAATTAAEIKNAVVSITTAAATEHTPVATTLPAELRVTIAKESEAPAR